MHICLGHFNNSYSLDRRRQKQLLSSSFCKVRTLRILRNICTWAPLVLLDGIREDVPGAVLCGDVCRLAQSCLRM